MSPAAWRATRPAIAASGIAGGELFLGVHLLRLLGPFVGPAEAGPYVVATLGHVWEASLAKKGFRDAEILRLDLFVGP